ncbi:MAG: LCP family protein [Egibacteraceae bacterium]
MPEIGHSLPPGEFGPLERGGGRRGRRWSLRRIGMLVGAFVLVMGLTALTTAGALLWYGERSIGRVDVANLAGPAEAIGDIEETTGILNVLLVGDDSRRGLTDEQLVALGTDRVDGGRTDTVMLLQLDPGRAHASLLSFPRDLLVTRCDGSEGRINAAYGIGEADGTGGASCLVDTVTELTDIPIQHYVEVNFAGFIDVVDVLGGVTMYIEEPGLRDRYAGLDLEPGCQTLDGTDALGFVRARKIDNDFGRMARQQRFLRELLGEVASAGTLLNVPRLFSLVSAAGSAVETDQELSLADMRRIAFSLRNLTTDGLDTRVVPATPRSINGAAMAVVDEDEAEELFVAFREGSAAPDDLGREQPQEVDASDVPPLTVLNGTGVAGMAAAAAEELEGRGFTVEETGNADRFGYESVRVLHPRELLEEAELVAGAFTEAVVEVGEPGEPFTVVLGSDYDPTDPADDDGQPESTSVAADEPEPEPTFAGATALEHRC